MRHRRSSLVVLLVASAALAATAGCSSPSTAPTPAPSAPIVAPLPPPPPASAVPAGPDLTGTRVLRPVRGLFTVSVPTRFRDEDASSPAVTAVPAIAQAVRNGVGVLALDRRGSAYSPTVGGFCTRVQAQDLDQLAAELRESVGRTGSPLGSPRVEVLPPTGAAGGRVAVTYRSRGDGGVLDVVQVAGLAGPGRSCVVTASTDDATRDAALLTTVRDTLRLSG